MILLLGASGYIGQTFARTLRQRGCFFVPLTRRAIDYSQFDILFYYVRKMKPAFVINAAGYVGKPNVDACELDRAGTLSANTLLPQTISRVCLMTNTPWGHVSSGSIFSGAKVFDQGRVRIERNLNEPAVRHLFEKHPDRLRGFTELDEPNFSFLAPPCNFYSGTKALAEQTIRNIGQCYIWRPRAPFSQWDHPRNLLSKLQHYPKIYDHVDSISHVEEFVRGCLELWERRAPFGIYNMTNPGAVTTREIVEMIQRILKPKCRFQFWKSDEEFSRLGTKVPRSSAILDVSKLLAAGIKMRPVRDALEESLRNWHWAAGEAAPGEAETDPCLGRHGTQLPR